jgi:hypothetical protein
MGTVKLSLALDADLVREARGLAGPRGLSRLVNAALEQYLQAARLRQLEDEMVAEYGPISAEASQRAVAIKWPT